MVSRGVTAAERPHIGPFALDDTRPIGRGGMAAVWPARHEPSGTPVAVKVLAAPAGADDPSRDRQWVAAFHREARAVAGLDHPNIVSVLDTGVVQPGALSLDGRDLGGAPWLAMERAAGSLAEAVADNPPPWPIVQRVLLSLLSALATAHAHGLLHGDVKPSNVLITRDALGRDVIRLADFGIARALGESLEEEDGRVRIHGTRAYMAPEQLTGRWRDHGPWTDLYAVGCVACELLTGHPPTGLEVPGVPTEVARWIAGLLEPDWRARWPRAADAAHALAALRAAEPVGAAPTWQPMGAATLALTATDASSPLEATCSVLAVQRPREAAVDLAAPEPPVGALRRAPFPREWRTVRPSLAPRHLLGAGLGLFGLRELPLIGRDPHVDELWQALGEVHDRGGVGGVVLFGPSGAGRTRLARAVAVRAEEVGAADALWTDGERDLAPWLRTHLRASGLSGAALTDRVRSRVRLVGGDAGLVEGLVATIEGRPQLGAVAAWIEACSRQRPVLLVLDDLAPGDRAELARLLRARSSLGEGRILMIATAGEPLPGWDALPVGPLDAGGTARLARAVLAASPRLAITLEERSGGLPGAAIAHVAAWLARGDLVDGPDGFELREGVDPALPADGAVSDRLRQLAPDPDARRALALAAVLGATVDRARWAAGCQALGLDVDLDALVGDLARSGLAREHGPSWSFRDARTRRAVEIEDPERLHALAATLTDDDAERGRHLLSAGPSHRAQAAATLDRAASHAISGGRMRDALRCLTWREQALGAEDAPTADLVESWGRRGRLYGMLGELDTAERLASRAIEVARPLVDTEDAWSHALATGLTVLAYVVQRRSTPEAALAPATEAVERYQALGDDEGAVTALRALAGVAQRQSRLRDAEPPIREALARSRRIGAHDLIAACLQGLGNVAHRQGRFDEGRALLAEARAAAELAGVPLLIADIAWERGVLEVRAGRPDEAEPHLRDALALHERLGNLEGMGDLWNSLGDLAAQRGDLEAAELHFHRALAVFEGLGSTAADIVRANLGITLLDRGSFEAAGAILARALDAVLARGATRLLSYLYAALLPVHAHRRDWPAWERDVAQARRWLEDLDELTDDHTKLLRYARVEALAADRPDLADVVDALIATLGLRAASSTGDRAP